MRLAICNNTIDGCSKARCFEPKANGHRYSSFHAQQAIDYGKPTSRSRRGPGQSWTNTDSNARIL